MKPVLFALLAAAVLAAVPSMARAQFTATRGQKRITSLADDGTLRVPIAFAEGETKVSLTGYAAAKP